MVKRGKSVRKLPAARKAPARRQRAPADVDLKKENAALRRELAEALERQTADVGGSSGHQQHAWRAGAGVPGACWRTPRAFAGPNSARWICLNGDGFRRRSALQRPARLRRAIRDADVSGPIRKAASVKSIGTKQTAQIADVRTSAGISRG